MLRIDVLGHRSHQQVALLHRTDRIPELHLDLFLDLGEQAFSRIRVAGVAAEPDAVAFIQLKQDSVTLRACKRRWFAELLHASAERVFLVRNLHFDLHSIRNSEGSALSRVCRQPYQQRRYLAQGHDMVGLDVVERTLRHRWKHRIVGVLNDGDAAELLDCPQARRPAIEVSRQDDADRVRPVDLRGRSEQRTDRRPETILFRALRDTYATRFHQQVEVRRRNINPAGLQARGTLGTDRAEWTGTAQNVVKHVRRLRRCVQDDRDGSGKVGREAGNEPAQRFDAARRCADDHQMAWLHHVYSTLRARSR